MEDLKKFLTGKVLMFESDTLPAETEKVLRQVRREKTDKAVIFLSSGTSSIIAGSEKTWSAVRIYIDENEPGVELVKVGCTGPSNFEPLVCIQLPGKNKLYFRNITEEKVEPLLNGVFHNDINKDDLVGQRGSKGFELWPGLPFIDDLGFFARQKRVIMSNCGCYDPENINEYIARGGYRAFVKAIRHYTFEEVCDIIERSGLRGRSGGGYPTGLKWKQALNTTSNSRYLICNAKESDPGAFTDRTMLESDPHRMVEGVAIASYAIGASNAIVFFSVNNIPGKNEFIWTLTNVDSGETVKTRSVPFFSWKFKDIGRFTLHVEIHDNKGNVYVNQINKMINVMTRKQYIKNIETRLDRRKHKLLN